MTLNESIVEDAALEWFGELGYAVGHGPHLAPGEPAAERDSFSEVVLVGRLREAIRRLNPAIPEEAREEALRKVLRVGTPSLVQTNRAFHKMLRDGVPVEYPRPDGSIAGDDVRLIDFGDVRSNDWLVVNQFTVKEGEHNPSAAKALEGSRRPDIVVFLNGLPLGLIELKNAANEETDIWSAYAQLQTYKAEIPTLLHYNAALVVSDGLQARMGSITANQEWFKVWRTIDGEGDAPKTALELEVLVRGVFERQRFLDLLHHFIVFEEDPDSGALHKIIAGYHQFHAVNAAVEETVRASGMAEEGMAREGTGTFRSGRQRGGKPGDRRAGVVWHTQGSGKSFSMPKIGEGGSSGSGASAADFRAFEEAQKSLAIVPTDVVAPSIAMAPSTVSGTTAPTVFDNTSGNAGGFENAGIGGIGPFSNITINMDAGLVSSPATVGQDIIDAILAAQRDSGVVFAPAATF
jgi:type I restriction enzyme R subunit